MYLFSGCEAFACCALKFSNVRIAIRNNEHNASSWTFIVGDFLWKLVKIALEVQVLEAKKELAISIEAFCKLAFLG